jgi:quercetin dioxygenase-like cupin family protein
MRQSPVRFSVIVCAPIVLWMLAAQAQPEGTPAEFIGQTEALRVVHILDEPRHRTVFRGDNIRLLDVQINPGDTTLPHTHDSPILYTFISNGQGPLNGRLSSITSYVDEPLTHRVNNPGPNLFRIIALANFGEPVIGTADLPDGLDQTAELENPWFRAWRMTLEPGAESTLMRHHNPAFVVQVSEGELRVSRNDGVTKELLAAGDWAAIAVTQSYRLINSSAQAVTVVINEAR